MKKIGVFIFLCLVSGYTIADTFITDDNIQIENTWIEDGKCITPYDFQKFNINFCSDENLNLYRDIIKKQKVNYATFYYLTFIHGGNGKQIALVKPKDKSVYPVTLQFYELGGENPIVKDTPKLKYSLKDDKLCVLGRVNYQKAMYQGGIHCFGFNRIAFDHIDDDTILAKNLTAKDLKGFK